jgi:hypothetical protein
MMMAGLSIGQVAWIYVPIMLVWGIGAWYLGKAYTRLKARVE